MHPQLYVSTMGDLCHHGQLTSLQAGHCDNITGRDGGNGGDGGSRVLTKAMACFTCFKSDNHLPAQDSLRDDVVVCSQY